ncbi:MAG: VanZ family protein [Acidipropionibacterium sp.]|nr:VanZ family protein [Acidipropionibacterium sp.]
MPRLIGVALGCRPLRIACTIALALVIGVIVFDPSPPDTSGSIFSIPPVEFAANIVMFLPVGAVARWWRPSVWRNVLVGLVCTVIIESVQGLFLPHRVADIRDIVANTSGALIGSVVCWAIAGTLRRRGRP